VIYGWSSQLSRKYFAEQRFPNVLYRWLLQYSPRNVSELVESERRRRVLNFSLVGISVVLIFSAWFLVYLSRREETRLSLQKEEFFRNVSHELKTPLALIKMFSEMLVLGRGRDESTRREYLEIIFSETERMTFLINNILDFSNLERGIQKFSLEPLDLGEIVTRHLEAFEVLMKKEKVSIRLSIAEKLPRIMGDRNALALVLLNLLDNAVKYGKAADRRIEVELSAADGTLELRVRDNGIGISPSEQNRVFEKFFRSGNIAVRRVRGSGIGLSLVRYIVTAHQGTVGVESTPGEGSTFTIAFPVIRPARTS
jgi:two-component system phosphate regulon sensor histidine kinase PhoR